MVNLISKTPRQTTFANLTLEGGSFGEFEAGVDMNTTLDASGSVYGRVSLAYHQVGEFTDDVPPSRRLFFAPSITIDLTRNTRITFLGEFYEEWQTLGPSLPAVGTVLPNVNGPISIYRNIGEPDTWPFRTDGRRGLFGYQLEHRFNEVFTLRQNLRAGIYKADFRGVLGYELEPDERTLDRYPLNDPDIYQTVEVDTSLVAKFATGPWVNQTALAGVDFYYFHDLFKDVEGSIAPIDLYNPRYGAQPYGFATDVDQLLNSYTTGIYFQDQIELFQRVTIVAGGRGDFVNNDLVDYLAHAEDDGRDTAFSPRTGIVYEILPKTLSTYFSWSRSFLSQPFDLGVNGQPLPPERGEEYEVGLKADAFAGRLTGLLALYHIVRTNVPTPDETNPFFLDAVGEERHQGVDFDTTFSPVKGWNFIMSYGFIDARVTADQHLPSRVGLRPAGIPEDTYSIWTKYTLQTGCLRGFGAGIGFRYLTKQEGDAANTFTIPSYGLLNLALYYSRGRFKAQVNVRNATNERYFLGSYSAYQVQPGDPLAVYSSVGWGF